METPFYHWIQVKMGWYVYANGLLQMAMVAILYQMLRSLLTNAFKTKCDLAQEADRYF